MPVVRIGQMRMVVRERRVAMAMTVREFAGVVWPVRMLVVFVVVVQVFVL